MVMFLKPKSTQLNQKATLYRRINGNAVSSKLTQYRLKKAKDGLTYVYAYFHYDEKLDMFVQDKEDLTIEPINAPYLGKEIIINEPQMGYNLVKLDENPAYFYDKKNERVIEVFFGNLDLLYFDITNKEDTSIYQKYYGTTALHLIENNVKLSSVFNNVQNIGKYQLNKYERVGDFDYGIKGDIETTIGSPINGLMTPLKSFNIVTYDQIKLTEGDLVVVEGSLFSVENPTITIKRCPKPYSLQHAILNNIL